MCIKKPLEISDLQGDLLRMLLFLPKHIFDFSILRTKKGSVTCATDPFGLGIRNYSSGRIFIKLSKSKEPSICRAFFWNTISD